MLLNNRPKLFHSRLCYSHHKGGTDPKEYHHDNQDETSTSETVSECDDYEVSDSRTHFIGNNITLKDNLLVPPVPTLKSLSTCIDFEPVVLEPRNTAAKIYPVYSGTPSTLKSSLRKSKITKSQCQKLGVRGLWNENEENPFGSLDNALVSSIWEFATPIDLCNISMVSRRFMHTAEEAWDSIDATEVLDSMYHYYAKQNEETASSRTSQALLTLLQKRQPTKLTIRLIGSKLQPEDFLLSTKGLQELTLSGFDKLNDTNVLVMLLGVSHGFRQSGNKSILRKLCLNHCPLLTNGVVRSIATHCPNLQELSLRGCRNISDLTPLHQSFKHSVLRQGQEPSSSLHSLFASPPKPQTLGSLFCPPPKRETKTQALGSLFSPPPKIETKTQGLGSLFSPPPTLSNTKEDRPGPRAQSPPPSTPDGGQSNLRSLFALPGTSPPGRKSRAPISSLSTPSQESKLTHLDVSYTAVTPSAILKALRSTDREIELQSLVALGDSLVWHEDDFQELCEILNVPAMETLQVTSAQATPERGFHKTWGASSKLRSRLEASLQFC